MLGMAKVTMCERPQTLVEGLASNTCETEGELILNGSSQMPTHLIMPQPDTTIEIKERDDVVVEGLGCTVPRWNTKCLSEHLLQNLQ